MTRPHPLSEPEFADALREAQAGRHAQAIGRIERLAGEGALPGPRCAQAAEALAQIAALAEEAGDVARAVDALEAALRFRPGYADLHFRQARLLLSLQRRAEARRALERALARNPRYTAARLERALLDAADGLIGEALEALRALARETEVRHPGVYRQGLESLERAEWEEAGALFTRALGLDQPADGGAVERARTLLEQGEPARAAELLQAALPGRETRPDLHCLLGSAALAQGHVDDALASLARALELHPDFHAARVEFARALEAGGALVQAMEQVELVLEREPAHPGALQLHDYWMSRGRRVRRASAARDDV